MTRRPAVGALLALVAAGCGHESAPPIAGAPTPTATTRESAAADAVADEATRLGLPASFTNALELEFALVPAGTFEMGTPASEAGRGADETRHEVDLYVPCYLAVSEVTRAAWRRVEGALPAGDDGVGGDGAPVVGMTHDEARAFALHLGALDAKWSYRLPSEAEWERASRGPTASRLRGTTTAPWEWCVDGYADYPSWAVMSPVGEDAAPERALRGGDARLAARRHLRPAERGHDVGVRLAATLSYGKADEGACDATLVSFEGDLGALDGTDAPGYRVRLISVHDRLFSRQHGVFPLPWVTLHGTTPLRLRLPPGRYYVQVERPGGGRGSRGREVKFDAEAGPVRVPIPVPHPGDVLDEPQ